MVECYSIWILRLDLESSHYFASIRTVFDMFFTLWFFDLPSFFYHSCGRGYLFFRNCKFRWIHSDQRWKMHKIRDEIVRFQRKLYEPDHPSDHFRQEWLPGIISVGSVLLAAGPAACVGDLYRNTHQPSREALHAPTERRRPWCISSLPPLPHDDS